MSVTAVILAAGFSRRMGSTNKLLEEVGGIPILRRVAEAVVAVCDLPPVVVTGLDPGRVSNMLAGLDVRLVANPSPISGQATSVMIGLRHVADADTTLVVPGDQPFLTAAVLGDLLDAHGVGPPQRITVPMQGPARGNPIALPRLRRDEILTEETNTGCGAFTRKNPHLVHQFQTRNQAFFFDVDTPQDLARAKAECLSGAAG